MNETSFVFAGTFVDSDVSLAVTASRHRATLKRFAGLPSATAQC